MKRKLLFAGIAGIAVFSLIVFWNSRFLGNAYHVHQNFHDTAKFSGAEQTEAAESVKKKFRDFHGCTLTDLWYDVKMDYPADSVETSDQSFIPKGTKGKNIMLLLSNFRTPVGGSATMQPDTVMSNYQWWLIRDSRGKWEVVSYGYG